MFLLYDSIPVHEITSFAAYNMQEKPLTADIVIS